MAQANVQDEKGKERNKRRCTMELKILFVLHHLLILKPFMLGNRLKQKENYGQGRRARMAGKRANPIIQPKPTCMTWKEKNATAGRALNGIEDNFFLILIL